MNERWNLDTLYRGFEDPQYTADLAALQQVCTDFDTMTQRLAELEPLQALQRCTRALEEITALSNKLGEYASLRQAADTQDAEATSQLGQILGILSRSAGANARFQEYAAELPDLAQLLDRDAILQEYRFLFQEIRTKSRHLLGSRGEDIMAQMSLSGSSAWRELQANLTSSVQVEFRGGITNLSAIRNLAYDADPATRKEAYEAELACYKKIQDPVAYALNSIKLETINEARLRGYDSPLGKALQDARMQRATLDAMFSAIDDYLPKFWSYLRAKAKALGHANGLPWYDLFAPMGQSGKRYTTQEARDYLVELFGGFDPELRDMVARAFDHAWIDFFPREGKTGGAFCAGVECLNESRILTNFDGAFGDVVTLAHELGHAFHNHILSDQRPLNRDYTMPVAETASTFNECVIVNAAIQAASSKEEKLALIENQLSDATQIICDIYSRYRFETAVFANRPSSFMPAQQLCEMMLEAQRKSYGDGLDPQALHPYMWVCKSHYYGDVSFYNFPYAFGGLFARGLYAQYEQEGKAFLPKYKKLLHETPVRTVEGAAQVAGLDLTDKAFWAQGLQILSDEIDQFLALLNA